MLPIFDWLLNLDAFFWGYVGFSVIMIVGSVLAVQTRLFQLRALPRIVGSIVEDLRKNSEGQQGLHPIKAFFASVGGMVGIGNIVGIVTAIQLGGPGALFWVWIAGLTGTLIKYSEIYLGIRYREQNPQGGYNGGPMFFLQKAFNTRWVGSLVCVLLCFYGVEIYQFHVVVDTITSAWGLERFWAACALLGIILYAVIGGLPRVAKVCCWIMPLFMVTYVSLCLWLIGYYIDLIPALFKQVVHSAFTGHAALGGFAGSTFMLAIQNGMASACYAADIGIGYDSIIQSESRATQPERQACFALVGVLLDNLICTLSMTVVLITGLWQTPLEESSTPLVQVALGTHFPFIANLMPVFIFVLGYTTLLAYLIVGIKCAQFLYPERGRVIYLGYAVVAFLFFTFFDQTQALLLMRITGALLLILNLSGIFLLRREVKFGFQKELEGALI